LYGGKEVKALLGKGGLATVHAHDGAVTSCGAGDVALLLRLLPLLLLLLLLLLLRV